MLKIRKRITNPMTVIAIFAAISEGSAAVSLPFLDNEDREIYVWFLISFPFYLLFLFFITLNFNHRTLYSPSDFGKDKSFLKVIDNDDRDSKRHAPPHEPDTQATFGLSSHIVASETSAARRRDSCKVHNASDPPPGISAKAPLRVQHSIQLSESFSNLHIIDARDIDVSRELATILEKIPRTDRKTVRVIMFLSNHVSDGSLTKRALLRIRHANKGSGTTLCIIYNLCSQTVTLLGSA
ncbi:hypothetical protein AB4P91_11645 [Pseudomonas sp. B21128]|uniref:hypothetical protein n=1 Tax=Pseudomonas TaxID=286 RepID=UPI001242DFD4|nr:hypothetical protein [Pseudomonas fluorescens]VVO73192.1 hypothetical protein PS876_01403 [Pseudomonas fluorescens]